MKLKKIIIKLLFHNLQQQD